MEGARTRLVLAGTLLEEARLALATFEGLGAARDADAAAALLRQFGLRSRSEAATEVVRQQYDRSRS